MYHHETTFLLLSGFWNVRKLWSLLDLLGAFILKGYPIWKVGGYLFLNKINLLSSK